MSESVHNEITTTYSKYMLDLLIQATKGEAPATSIINVGSTSELTGRPKITLDQHAGNNMGPEPMADISVNIDASMRAQEHLALGRNSKREMRLHKKNINGNSGVDYIEYISESDSQMINKGILTHTI